jgi:dTDP-4-amino-4,6-dideoxygalactose transaminase
MKAQSGSPRASRLDGFLKGESAMSEQVSALEELAIHGGPKAKTTPNYPMYPGGLEIGEEEKQEVLEVLERKYLFRYYGPQEYPSKVRQLEVEFSQKVGSEYALAVNSCTSALISSLIAVGVGPGCEVIVPGYTFFASAAAIVGAKAIPVVAEVDATLTLDPDDFERKITPYTKAVISVHMRGVPCNMGRIMEIARKHDIKVVEDVAQAVGGTYHGKYLGTFGDCGAYSFQYHKIITAGEGGMVVTDDWLTYQRAMGYHDTAACWRPERFGEERFAGELFCGVNYRMNELSGAVLLAQLRKLDPLLAAMRRNQHIILDGIRYVEGITPRPVNDPEGDTAICVIFYLDDADKVPAFTAALRAEGVAATGRSRIGASETTGHQNMPDWHVYDSWDHIINQGTPTADGCPYKCPLYHGDAPSRYAVDMCPNTLAYLNRSVHIDIPARMTEEDSVMVVKAIRKVADAML